MKGIFTREDGRFIAQYWNKELRKNVYIGVYGTPEEAIQARSLYITKVYDGLIDDSIPKVKKYPKNIDERCGRYRATIQMGHGVKHQQTTSIYIGTFDTVEEAVEARKEFILKLL